MQEAFNLHSRTFTAAATNALFVARRNPLRQCEESGLENQALRFAN